MARINKILFTETFKNFEHFRIRMNFIFTVFRNKNIKT